MDMHIRMIENLDGFYQKLQLNQPYAAIPHNPKQNWD